MNKNNFDPKEWNDKLAAFIGYKYKEEKVLVSINNHEEDVPTTVLSEVEIVVDSFENGKYKYLGRVEPSNPEEWDSARLEIWNGTIQWASENRGRFMYSHLWNPDKDWNQLMKVVNEIGMLRVSAKIEETYNDVCMAVEDYGNR
jgi:hypothetical protein